MKEDKGPSSKSSAEKQAGAGKGPEEDEAPAGPVSRLLDLLVRKHLHPISVHFPNGILPAAVLFLFLALVFELAGLAHRTVLSVELWVLHEVAFLNLVLVVLSMPVVLFSGFLHWKKRFRGIMTKVIRTKIICGFIVLALGIFLLAWRIFFPIAVTAGGPVSWLYFLVNIAVLVPAVIAGNLGGRLVFGKK
ncbi:MAG: DUF2231 domain-containing protein [bacterium]